MIDLGELRRRLCAGEISPDQALLVVNDALMRNPSADWWVLRGQLIQLCESPGYELCMAAESFESAARLEPDNPAPLEELGRFYDAVMAQPDRARAYYEAAIARGAGKSCSEALANLDSDDE